MSDEIEYGTNDTTAPAPTTTPAIEYATDDPYADVPGGDVVRAPTVAMKRPARMSFPISSGRAPLGATPPRGTTPPLAGARAPFGATAARRMSFPISSGRGPLGTRRAPAAVTTAYDDGAPDVPPTKESA